MRMSPRGSESATARAFRRCGVQGQMTRGDIDRDQPVGNVVTLRELINDKLEARRWNTLVITLFGVLAISLTKVGVFGLVSYSITSRFAETGVRMAVGACPSSILLMSLRETLTFRS